MELARAIHLAESLLPGTPGADNESDPRWQAIIEIGSHIEKEPEPIWEFIVRWGDHDQEDLREAVGCCLLEHLLEHHFEQYFPRVETLASKNRLFGDTFRRCWRYGKSEQPGNRERFDALKASCESQMD